jgi:ParB family chromosome partitioning protein
MENNPLKKNKMTGLGRGLGALLQENEHAPSRVQTPAPPRTSPSNPLSGISEIDLSSIEVNPYQPRTHFDEEALQELGESIRIQGIIQPITVRKTDDNRYQLISGERRFQASKLIGLTRIPAYIRTANDQQMLEMALIENIQRENLNAIEIALSYQRLMHECNLKQEELGDRVGKNRTTVNNYMRLLRLPPVIQAAVRDSKISMGHARALITIDAHDVQLKLFRKIVEEGWSVRKVEEEVRKLSLLPRQDELTSKAKPAIKQEIKALQYRLSSVVGSKVSIKSDENRKGEIKIPFGSKAELDRILDNLKIER